MTTAPACRQLNPRMIRRTSLCHSSNFRCRLIRWFLPVQLTLRSLSQQTKKEKPLSKKQRIRISPFTSRQRPKANLTSLSKARSALLQTGAVFLPMRRKTRLWLNKRQSSSDRVSLSCAIWDSLTWAWFGFFLLMRTTLMSIRFSILYTKKCGICFRRSALCRLRMGRATLRLPMQLLREAEKLQSYCPAS